MMQILNASIIAVSTLCLICNGQISAACTLTWGDYEIFADGSGSAELLWTCDQSMLAFQFDVAGFELTNLRDGWCGEDGWQLYSGPTTAIGFTLGQPPLPPAPEPAHFVTIDFVVIDDRLEFAESVLFVAPPDEVIEVDWTDFIDLAECTADIYPKGTGDGIVGVDEILSLLGDWSSTDSPYDVDGDGAIGVDDLLMVLSAWGPCE